MLRNQKRKVMEQFISTPNSILIQGATMSDLESMLSRLLDKKLADIIDSTLKVDVSPKDGLYKRKVAEGFGSHSRTSDVGTCDLKTESCRIHRNSD